MKKRAEIIFEETESAVLPRKKRMKSVVDESEATTQHTGKVNVKQFKNYAFLFVGFIIVFALFLIGLRQFSLANRPKQWEFQSIDTMKYSRDMTSDSFQDPNYVKQVDQQVAAIAKTGATHVAIATPYDDEFLPILKLWVRAARRHHLNVWFRGNWSGWEGWHGYGRIDEQEHIDKTRAFILNNTSLFENGDVFTACTECENGNNPDLGNKDTLKKYRAFLIKEYGVTKESFASIHKDVKSNYDSMSGRTAMIVMDKETTQALDGLVVIDHYVKTPEQLINDINFIAQNSGGSIVLGEVGAPVPDITGTMSVQQQKDWLEKVFSGIVKIEAVKGINYWVNMGGSTALWETNGHPKPVVGIISTVFEGRFIGK